MAFWLWTGPYFTTPFLIAAAWIVNRRLENREPVDDVIVPAAIGRLIGAIGVLAVAMSLFSSSSRNGPSTSGRGC